MYNDYALLKLAKYNQKIAEEYAANERLCKLALAGKPDPLARILEKIAGTLIETGEALKGITKRETLLNP
ncbi:MAG: hypothetical protein MUO76_06175 [Anaerolineaceae bacterium]|nr:hypothetical protein [Anaerolineaceae bacterium]